MSRETVRLSAIAHRLEQAAAYAEKSGAPGYARKLRDDAAWIRALLGPKR